MKSTSFAKLRLLLCSAILCALTSCVESEHALSEASKSQVDSRLYGLWLRTNERGDVDYLHVGREAAVPLDPNRTEPEPGLMRFCTITHVNETRALGDASSGRFFCTRIGDADVANWVFPAEPAKNKPITYWFLKYRVDEKQLVIWDQDPEATAAAIEAGRLKGVVKRKPNREIDELRVTDTSETVAAFFAAGGEKACFPDKPGAKSIYSRVR
jgi:hypothetical protein